MSRPVLRHWCGRCQFPGKREFLMGTVQAETELEALRLLEALWGEIALSSAPRIVPLPGLLAFQPEGHQS